MAQPVRHQPQLPGASPSNKLEHSCVVLIFNLAEVIRVYLKSQGNDERRFGGNKGEQRRPFLGALNFRFWTPQIPKSRFFSSYRFKKDRQCCIFLYFCHVIFLLLHDNYLLYCSVVSCTDSFLNQILLCFNYIVKMPSLLRQRTSPYS